MISDPLGTIPPDQPKPPVSLYTFGCFILFIIVAMVALTALGPVAITLGLGVPIFSVLLYSYYVQYQHDRTDPKAIREYARSREPEAPAPIWRDRPEEFSLGVLDTIGKPPRPPMPSHAITAAENARCDYHTSEALALDVGLLVYSAGAEAPALYREAPVPDNAIYVQPFAEIWLEQPLDGVVRMLLLAPDGTLQFETEAVFNRDDTKGRGRHTVLSPTRLPIGDHLPTHQDGWSLQVEVIGKCISEHTVNWYDRDSANALVEHMATDGELTVDLAALVEQVALTPLSLDELLGEHKLTDAGSEG